MTTTITPKSHETTMDNFTQVYNFTLSKLHRSEYGTVDTVLLPQCQRYRTST